jgi:spermidine/putrescine transport system permease protein
MPFIRKIDKNLINASKDLGSSGTQTIFKVVLPLLRPAIITATFICFAMSFDDFIISYFTSGMQTNVSTFMYTAKRIQPYINAFGTMLVVVIFLAIIFWNLYKLSKQKIQEERMKIKNGEYKLKKIKSINKKIERLQNSIDHKTKVRPSKNLKWWWKYFALRQQLRVLKNKNYNAKISKLEWKKELITNEIRSEKRVFKTYENAQKKQTQLQQQLAKDPTSHRVPRFTNAINKLDKKMIKLEREIEWINSRRENEKDRVVHLTEAIDSLKTEMANTVDISKKDIQWYTKRIHFFTVKRNIFVEGKKQYRLRMIIEKLATLRSNNLEAIQKVYEQLNAIELKVFKTVSLTEKLDKKISIAKQDKTEEGIARYKELLAESREELATIKKNYGWKIVVLEEKLKWIEMERQKKYDKYFAVAGESNFKSKNWFQKSWKGVTLTSLIAISFGGLTTAYVLNNSYDIVIGNWGSYIDMEWISEFEEKYGVTVNYQQYDSNESLYNKVQTMNYDVMVPSDYMVQRMSDEERLEKLDWTKIETLTNPLEGNTDAQKEDSIDETIKNVLGTGEDSILNFAIPYFWGDVRVALNTDSDAVKKFIADNKLEVEGNLIKNFDWNLLWTAADAGLKINLTDDAKNLFMIGTKSLGKDFGVEPTLDQIDQVKNKLATLIKKNNVSLLGDQLISQMGDGRFDIAVAYNGDIMYGEEVYMGLDEDADLTNVENQPFDYAVPTQGTNIWSDNMVISKRNRNMDLSYKFVNFMISKSVDLSDYAGYPVASSNAMKELYISKSSFLDLFKPTDNGDKYTFDESRDNAIVNAYNEIVAGKN